jgi:molecular chaperone GrpE
MSKKKSKKTHRDIPIQDEQVNSDEGAPEQPELKVAKAADTTGELEELKQKMQRLGADYHNYQKRSQRQIEQTAAMARESIVKAILPVLDNFEHMLDQCDQATDVDALLKGVQIVYDHLLNIFKSEGVRRIEVKEGCGFDPSLHEALLHEESDQVPANTVVRELARGYTMNDHTLRPAKVSVAKPPAEDSPVADEDAEPSEDSQQ